MSVQTVTGQLNLAYTLAESLVLSTQTFNATPTCALNYSIGNGLAAVADSIDLHVDETRTLAASATHTYTLSAITDTLPRTVAFASIRRLIILVTSRTAGDYLTFGPGVTHGWTAVVATGTQRVYQLFVYSVDKTDSLAVSSGSNDQLTVTNAGSNSMTFRIFFDGCSG